VSLDFLLSIARDSTATEVERRKAALAIAEFLLPKKQGAKKRGKFPTDEFGFSVDPELVREFRDISWTLACLPLARKKFAPDAFARKVAKLQGRLDQIRPLLQCPCPSKYGEDQLKLDDERLKIFRERRAANVIFSPVEDWEEAHRLVRQESFLAVLKWLRESDRRSFARRNARLTGVTLHHSHRCRQLRTACCHFSILLIRRRRPPNTL
jgi:hypothetical protein